MKKKRKTEGFTLVELIIAVAILGIVISPLIANFIQSAKLNRKAKISLNATNMAQDILEGASSYSADEFIKMFESEATLVGQIIPAGLTYTSHGDMEAAGMNSASGSEKYSARVGSFNAGDGAVGIRQYTSSVKAGLAQDVKREKEDPTTHVKTPITDYYLYANGVRQGKNNYNLRFHLSTSNGQNDKNVANIASINKTYDAVFNLSNDEAESKAEEFVNRAGSGSGHDAAFYLNQMSRKISIRILDDNNDRTTSTAATKASGNKYVVEVIRTYEVPSGIGVADGQRVITETTSNISTLDETLLPRSVYLYFNGMPGSTETSVKDHIEIINVTGKEMTVYLIRTQKESEKDTLTVQNYNNSYGADVVINSATPSETQVRDYTNDTMTHIVSNLRYNLNTDIKNNIRVLQEGSVSEVVDSKYTATTPTDYKQGRCQYTYNGAAITENLYKTNFSAGYQVDNKNFIYDVTLDVWDTGSGKKVASFTSSLSD